MKAIRWFLGKLILTFDALFPPKTPTRSAAEQAKVDGIAAKLVLYQFEACPFCVRVRRALKRLGMRVEIRDAMEGTPGAEELVRGGGQRQVPCLRILEADGSFRWLYESADIIEFLRASVQS